VRRRRRRRRGRRRLLPPLLPLLLPLPLLRRAQHLAAPAVLTSPVPAHDADGACNPLVAEQSVKQIVAQLPESSGKFMTSSRQAKFPCDSVDHNIFFMGSEYQKDFVKDLSSMKLNEGWTVTYWSLQVLYYVGCQQVVIVGMDHSFQQSGKPGKLEVFKGPDVNHFDESYFAGKQWHLAGLENNERYYRIAKKQFEAAGRRIIDATVDGKCKVTLPIYNTSRATPTEQHHCSSCSRAERATAQHTFFVAPDLSCHIAL
jgi:hypothetical protein